ncbi:uncharacterized protein LOC144206513 [Stigmatopora nigra]
MSDVENQPKEELLVSENKEILSPLQVVTEIPPIDVVDESKILKLRPTTKSTSVNFSPQLSENQKQIMRKNNSNLDTLGDLTHDDPKEIFSEETQKASGSLEASVAEIVSGIIDSALRNVDLLSRKESLDFEKTKMSSVVPEASQIEFLPQQAENLDPITPKQDYIEVRTEANQEPGTFQEERKEPESQEATVIADFITELIQSAVKDAYLPTQKDPSELDHEKTLLAANPEVVSVEEEKIIAPTRKSKSLKMATQPQEKVTVTKDEYDLEPEDQAELCQGSFGLEVKKESENEEASVNPVTGITEPAITDVHLLPNKEETSSAVVTPSQDVVGDKNQVSKTRKKSKRGKLHGEKVTATEQQSDSSNQTKEPSTPQPPQRKSRRSESAKTGMTLTQTPKLPSRKKSKNEDVSSSPSIAVNVVLNPESGLQATPEQSSFEGSKLSPPKRRPKSLKSSPEPQKVQDQTLTKEEPHTLETKTTELTVCRVLEENTSETESGHVTLQQTTTPTETLIELELLETERLEEAEDCEESAISVEDSNVELEKSLFFIDSIPGGAIVDTLQLNICNQVQDQEVSVVDRESKEDSSVLLTTLQPNATEMIEIVLCEKSMEKTATGLESLQNDQDGVTGLEEYGANSVFTDTSQDTSMGIHVLPVEMEEHQEDQKDKLASGNEDCEKPMNNISLVEKQETSKETREAILFPLGTSTEEKPSLGTEEKTPLKEDPKKKAQSDKPKQSGMALGFLPATQASTFSNEQESSMEPTQRSTLTDNFSDVKAIAETELVNESEVENASAVLRQLEAEFPEPAPIWASVEEVLDMRRRWGRYQDRLECEHHALSALELRVANLFGVSANLEPAPLNPLCQQLQAMQASYQK